MLNWVLGRKSKRRKGRKRKLGKKPAYEKAKQIAANGSAASVSPDVTATSIATGRALHQRGR